MDLARDVSTGQVIDYAVTTLSEVDAGEIDSIFVKEAYRGTGVENRLMKRALAWLDENRARTKTIVVATGNEHVHWVLSTVRLLSACYKAYAKD